MRLVGDSHKQVQKRRSRARRCPEIGVTCDSFSCLSSEQQLRPIVASQMAPNTAAQERLGEIMVFGMATNNLRNTLATPAPHIQGKHVNKNLDKF